MGLDIRLPIGFMFSLFGLILTLWGAVTGGDETMYRTSLGININLWSGIVMLVFGGWMLWMAYRAKRKRKVLKTGSMGNI